MTNRETLAQIAREWLADVPVPPEDWEALLPQIERLLAAVAGLDELPLEAVEPASIYRTVP